MNRIALGEYIRGDVKRAVCNPVVVLCQRSKVPGCREGNDSYVPICLPVEENKGLVPSRGGAGRGKEEFF